MLSQVSEVEDMDLDRKTHRAGNAEYHAVAGDLYRWDDEGHVAT